MSAAVYRFEVRVESLDGRGEDTYYGMVFAENYSNAVTKITNDFGENELLDLSIAWIADGDNDTLVFSEAYKDIWEKASNSIFGYC